VDLKSSGSKQEITREKRLNELLNSLQLFPSDLNRIILEYEKTIQYHVKSGQIWNIGQGSKPLGIITDGQFIYTCDHSSTFSCLHVHDLNGQIVQKIKPTLSRPSGIDFYQNLLYIIDQQKISIFNNQLQLLSSFPIQSKSFGWNNLKVDNNLIYTTIYKQHQIFIYTREGNLNKTLGSIKESSEIGEYDTPCGLTVDKKILYICDNFNHRIQSLSKVDYSFYKQWGERGVNNGQFEYPYSIFHWENILYIGDYYSLQLFTCDGTFVQRIGKSEPGRGIGEFNDSCGACVLGDQVYVTDRQNCRIQVFSLN